MRCDRYLEMGLLIIIPHSTMWYMIVCVHVYVRLCVYVVYLMLRWADQSLETPPYVPRYELFKVSSSPWQHGTSVNSPTITATAPRNHNTTLAKCHCLCVCVSERGCTRICVFPELWQMPLTGDTIKPNNRVLVGFSDHVRSAGFTKSRPRSHTNIH